MDWENYNIKIIAIAISQLKYMFCTCKYSIVDADLTGLLIALQAFVEYIVQKKANCLVHIHYLDRLMNLNLIHCWIYVSLGEVGATHYHHLPLLKSKYISNGYINWSLFLHSDE